MRNKSLLLLVLLVMHGLAYSFSCDTPRRIVQQPIEFNAKRIQLTQEYQKKHYGIDSESINIEPKMIVLHWTCIDDLKATLRVFYPSEFPANSPRLKELPDTLNVSTHYLVDRDGTIYQLMPDHIMARHVIGLNHYAIGIENIGGVDSKDDLTQAQAESNAYLVCHLKKKYPEIEYVIGHQDYLKFKKSKLWLEKDPNYQTDKFDPSTAFVNKVKALAKHQSA